MRRLAHLLIAAGLVAAPATANTVFLISATPSGTCSDSVTATPIATVTLTGVNCTNGPVTLTASSLDFLSSIVGTGAEGDIGGGNATVEAHTISAIALGGTGTGSVNVNYADQFTFGLGFLGGHITARVGQAVGTFNGTLNTVHIAAAHSDLLPIVFGESFAVPMAELFVEFANMQSHLELSASETVTFDVLDAQLNPIPGATVTPGRDSSAEAPEPSTAVLYLGGIGLLLALRRVRFSACPLRVHRRRPLTH
jgi:hypothetical protein